MCETNARIGFWDCNHLVRERYLLLRLHTVRLIEPPQDVLRVDDRDDGVELVHLLQLVVVVDLREESLHDGSRIGEAGRLYDDAVEPLDLLVETPQ